MATITTTPVSSVRALETTTNPKAPVNRWFWAGVVFISVEIIALSGWFITGQAERTDPGPTPIPDWMQTVLGTWQLIGLPLALFTLWVGCIRPWRRTGRLTPTGMFTLSMFTVFWQDTLLNYVVTYCTYNAFFFNLGAWNSNILGWVSPYGHRVAEPLFWTLPVYVYLVVPWVLIGTWSMRKAKARWPGISNVRLFLIAFAWTAAADCVIEPLFMRLGVWTYPGAIDWLTINAGKYYQFPVYEAVFWGACCASWSSLLYFLDDRGRTVVEKGSETLKTTAKKNTAIRFVAFLGAVNAIFLVVYNVPAILFSMHGSEWPEDIVQRSYFTNGFCGPGTTYACPSPENPMPREGSARVGPDGELIPAGTPRCIATIPMSATDPNGVPLAGPAPNCPPVL